MSGLASVESERAGSWLVLRIRGEIDTSNVSEISEAIEAAVPNAIPMVAVDLTHTTYLDSVGVKLLFLLAERLRVRRREFRLVVPESAPIRAVLELTGLSRLVPLEDHLEHDRFEPPRDA
jgi:anti-anti-sigma factor